MPSAHVPETMEYLRHAHGHCGLPGAWAARETHVQGRRIGREPHLSSKPLHQKQRGNLADSQFHREEADQFTIEFS